MTASARVERNICQLNEHVTYIGLLKTRSLLMRFRKWELDRFQSLSLNHQRDGLDFVLRDWLVLCTVIKGRVCFFGPGLRAEVCFLHWLFLTIWLCFQGDVVLITSSRFRDKVFSFGSHFSNRVSFSDWPIYLIVGLHNFKNYVLSISLVVQSK